MTFNIRKSYPYKRCEVKCDDTTIDLGLLNERESKDLAVKLIDAAYDLIYNYEEEIAKELCDILEKLK